MRDLGTLGGSFGFATELIDRGEVAGGATTTDDEEFHAFFWRKGLMTDLGSVGNDTCSVAHSMNIRGQVVGTSGDCGGTFELHGFIWQKDGPMLDLNEFVPLGSDLVITDGETINDRGDIAGSGMLPNGDFHAVVLIACGEAQPDDGCREAEGNVRTSGITSVQQSQTRRHLTVQDVKRFVGSSGRPAAQRRLR
jgi:probable HAF family extracellular repeat protein